MFDPRQMMRRPGAMQPGQQQGAPAQGGGANPMQAFIQGLAQRFGQGRGQPGAPGGAQPGGIMPGMPGQGQRPPMAGGGMQPGWMQRFQQPQGGGGMPQQNHGTFGAPPPQAAMQAQANQNQAGFAAQNQAAQQNARQQDMNDEYNRRF